MERISTCLKPTYFRNNKRGNHRSHKIFQHVFSNSEELRGYLAYNGCLYVVRMLNKQNKTLLSENWNLIHECQSITLSRAVTALSVTILVPILRQQCIIG